MPLSGGLKAWLIVVPFVSALADEGAGWLVRFVDPSFAWLKIIGFLTLQASLAALVLLSLWAVFTQKQAENYTGFVEDEDDGDAWEA